MGDACALRHACSALQSHHLQIWNCSQDHSNHIVHEFFKSPHFNDGIPIIPGAYESLSRLSSHCDLVVVTSRQHIIQDVTLEWIDRHYGGLFKETYFGNHFALSGTSRKKSEICRCAPPAGWGQGVCNLCAMYVVLAWPGM